MNRMDRWALAPVRMWLRWVMDPEAYIEKVGDLDEAWDTLVRGRGVGMAVAWYWFQGLRIGILAENQKHIWRVMMWRSYLKSVGRVFLRNKGYSALNILGLVLGMACALALFMVVHEELSYDRYHRDGDRVYRVVETIENATASRHYAPIAWPLGPAAVETLPQVEAMARIYGYGEHLIQYEDKTFYESRFYFVDASLFEVLTFRFLEGDAETALLSPNSLVLTQSMSRKYFGSANPMGQTLLRDGTAFEVTGVVADPPRSTHFKYQFIASMGSVQNERMMSNWWGTEVYTYVKLRPHVDVEALSRQLLRLGDAYVGGNWASGENLHLFKLQRLTDIHLHSKLRYELEAPGDLGRIRLLAGIGLLVLLVSCVNYVNLSTARSATRAKEVALRKVVGAQRGELVRQFGMDSLLMALVTMTLALVLLGLSLPVFNRLAGTAFGLADLFRPVTLLTAVLIAVITGVGAGLYPAWLLSSFQPAGILKGQATRGRGGARVRRVMVVFQFLVAALLAISTLVIGDQIDYMKHRSPGFDKQQKLFIPVRGGASIVNNYREVKEAFLRHPGVREATVSSSLPGRQVSNYSIALADGADPRSQGMYHLYIDEDFLPVYQIDLVAGRGYIADLLTDVSDWSRRESGGFVVNEAAVKALGFASPEEILGHRLKTGAGGRIGPVLGVTRDFHYKGLQNEVEPLIMEYFTPVFRVLTLVVDTQNLDGVMDHVREVWNRTYPGVPLEAHFLDVEFDNLYQAEEQLGRVAGTFTLLGLLVACLGLVGLSAFTAAQRTKEIGIRKTLGASVSQVLALLSRDYVRWIFIANALAWPLAWLLMRRWLDSFATRGPLTPVPFVLTCLGTLVAALVAVGSQSLRAASMNPTRSLRQE